MKLTLRDLTVEENAGFSYHDFPYLGAQPWKHKLGDPAYDVKIGRVTIASIVVDEDGVWHVTNVYSRFKTKIGAMRGLLRRLNENEA